MKITGSTTLAELTLLRAKLGLVLISFNLGNEGKRVACIQYADDFPSVFYGEGVDEATALDVAIEAGEKTRQAVREGAPLVERRSVTVTR
jgi:hypothetical protein